MFWLFLKIDFEIFGIDWVFFLSYNGKRKKEVSVMLKWKLWYMMIIYIWRKLFYKCKFFNLVKLWF